MALVLAPLALTLLIAAILVITLDALGWKLAGLLISVLAVLLLGVAWGLWHSVALTEAAEAERRLDEVLTAAAHSSGLACGSAGSPRQPSGSTNSEGPAGTEGSAAKEGAPCGSTGLVCGSSTADGGCGASCLARTR